MSQGKSAAVFSFAEAVVVSLLFLLGVRGAGFSVPPGVAVRLWAAGVPACFAALWILNIFALKKLGRPAKAVAGAGRTEAGPVRDPGSQRETISFFDENGSLRLAVRPEDVFCIEADGNYAVVRYAGARGEPLRQPVRCRIHALEKRFEGGPFVRCRRGCIVNMARVRSLRKGEDGYVLDLETGPVGVTRTYEARVLASLGAGNL